MSTDKDFDYLGSGDEKPGLKGKIAGYWRQFRSSGGEKFLLMIRRVGLRGLAALIGIIFLYYLLGMIIIHTIDDNTEFRAPDPIAGGSRAVDMAAALIDREVNDHGWRANDPFFIPSYLLDNMPNYQKGILSAVSRFTIEMTDQIGRSRGSSQVDADLEKANGDIRYSPDIWYFDISSSILPVATAEDKYLSAVKSLRSYNERLADGNAVFERRADNLINTLDRILADIGSSSAVIDLHLKEGPFWLLDVTADDIFYTNKGKIYAYYMILDALGRDFGNVIAEKELQVVWDQMLDSMRQAAELQPWVVISASPDSQIMPSHLASQGFYLLRARTQLREISNILLK